MMTFVRRCAFALISALALIVPGGPAQALCVVLGPGTVSPPAATLPDYDPFSTTDTILDMNFSVSVPLLAICGASISFTRSAGLPAVMSQGASNLQYSIEVPSSGQTLLQTTGFVSGSSPVPGTRYDFLLPLLGATANVPVRIRIPAGQLVASGNYSDNQLNATVVALGDLLGTMPTGILKQQGFVPSVNVVSKCVLPAPSISTLDFSSAISNGHPNPGVIQSSVFNNVRCTAPSVLRLSGGAMQPVGSVPAQSGFDNFINWRAAGTFGSAATVLNTNSASQATSPTKNTPSGATPNGTINVDVNLMNGNPIIAGSYRSTLTVTIDPNL
jgi:hypothetical protein